MRGSSNIFLRLFFEKLVFRRCLILQTCQVQTFALALDFGLRPQTASSNSFRYRAIPEAPTIAVLLRIRIMKASSGTSDHWLWMP
jgi:hypothetical protein